MPFRRHSPLLIYRFTVEHCFASTRTQTNNVEVLFYRRRWAAATIAIVAEINSATQGLTAALVVDVVVDELDSAVVSEPVFVDNVDDDECSVVSVTFAPSVISFANTPRKFQETVLRYCDLVNIFIVSRSTDEYEL